MSTMTADAPKPKNAQGHWPYELTDKRMRLLRNQ